MTTNSAVYYYTVTYTGWIYFEIKQKQFTVFRFSKYFFDIPRVIFLAFIDRVITQFYKTFLTANQTLWTMLQFQNRWSIFFLVSMHKSAFVKSTFI
jgi:hypothetical protein